MLLSVNALWKEQQMLKGSTVPSLRYKTHCQNTFQDYETFKYLIFCKRLKIVFLNVTKTAVLGKSRVSL